MSGKQRQRRTYEKPSPEVVWQHFADYLEQNAADIVLASLPIETVQDMRLHFLACAREESEEAKCSRWPEDAKERARQYRAAVWLLQLELNRDKAWRKRQLCLDFDFGDLY